MFDPTLFSMNVQSGDTDGDQIFDAENGIDRAPATKLLPTRQTKFNVGFGVTTPSDLVVQVTPKFDYDDSLFTS